MLAGPGVQESQGNPCPGFQRPARKPGVGPRVLWGSSWGRGLSTLGGCRREHFLQLGGGGTWLSEARKPLPMDRGLRIRSRHLLWAPVGMWADAEPSGCRPPLAGTPAVTVSMRNPTASMPRHRQAMDTPTQGVSPSPAPEGSQTCRGQMHQAGNDGAV